MGLGTLLLAASAVLLFEGSPRRDHVSTITDQKKKLAAASSFPTVGVSDLTYEPGHASGWHVHSGVHSVVVLSGILTIYDKYCQAREFGPGDVYLGGNEPHLARNEREEPAHLAVTSVYTDGGDPGRPTPPPANCGVR